MGPASAKSVQSYVTRAFGDRLGQARAAMEVLAASLPPEELNRVGFRLYERFRPDVPEGAQGWGAKGELRVERIVGAAGDMLPLQTSDHPSASWLAVSRPARMSASATLGHPDPWVVHRRSANDASRLVAPAIRLSRQHVRAVNSVALKARTLEDQPLASRVRLVSVSPPRPC
jgi:hypothetical protein